MKKTFLTLFLLLACSLALSAAQSQNQPRTDQDQQNMPSSSMSGDKMIFTGCLQSGSEPNSYVLSNPTPSDQSQESDNQQSQDRSDYDQSQGRIPDQSQESTEPSELARAYDSGKSFTLIPEGRVDLKSLVGTRVEVTGKMIESSSRTTQSSRATTPSGQSSTIHSTTEMTGQPQFRVSSVRQIANSCQ